MLGHLKIFIDHGDQSWGYSWREKGLKNDYFLADVLYKDALFQFCLSKIHSAPGYLYEN